MSCSRNLPQQRRKRKRGLPPFIWPKEVGSPSPNNHAIELDPKFAIAFNGRGNIQGAQRS
jgi:hypothetical protein